MVFDKYAEYYDLIYQDKDYEKECDFIEDIFAQHSAKQIKSVLDVGCGTGGHAIPLSKRGYKVTGIDSSAGMIKRAKEKSKSASNPDFKVMDLLKLNLDDKFDVCICMFAVMDYITQTEDILKTLRTIREHLVKDSLFIFDFWNGLAVLRTLPSVRVKSAEDKGKRVIRIAEPELDAFNHLCRVHYHLLILQNNTLLDEFEETHTIRYFFPQERVHYLQDCGFEPLQFCPFLDLEGRVDENVWNVTAIARAI
ncbi:class I SAM-dependent DNA methyltransferase [Chloroflexota bacterium]